MTTFINANLKKSDTQTNIEKYRVSAHRILHNYRVAVLSTLYNLNLSGITMLSLKSIGQFKHELIKFKWTY